MRLVKKELLYLEEKELKKKIVTRIMAMMMVAGAMFGATGLTSYAAEATATETTVKQAINADVVAKVFDATYYAEKNPDVVAVIGNDPAVLLQHYIDFGIYEGRDASATFNATIYAAANTDLMTVFGNNLEALIGHYVDFGQAEGRVASNDALKATGKNIASVAAPVSSSGSESSAGSGSSSGSSSESNSSSTYVSSLTDPNQYFNVLTGEITDTPTFGCIRFDEYHKYYGTDTIVTEWDFDKGVAAQTVKLGETFRSYDDSEHIVNRYVGDANHYWLESGYYNEPIAVDHESNLTSEQVEAVNAAIEDYHEESSNYVEGVGYLAPEDAWD